MRKHDILVNLKIALPLLLNEVDDLMIGKPVRTALLILAIACVLNSSFMQVSSTTGNAMPTRVSVVGRRLLVDGLPFTVRGVGYSPVPIGIDPETTPPYGDRFTSDFDFIYERDLPLLRQMGANTIRLWGWNNSANHTDFLDQAYNDGVNPIRVIATFWMPNTYNISSPSERTHIKAEFRNMVALHKNHPAILMWAIGNELNADWMYRAHLDDLFTLVNEMAAEAHAEEGATAHPVTTPLVDVNVIDTISRYDSVVGNLDVWSVQTYRGITFGILFDDYATASSKPLAILEYGIDAYDNRNNAEYEAIGIPYQAIYAEALWREIAAHSNVCIGGSIMAYSDEWWKGKHFGESNPSYHGTAGYATGAHPDGYSNEEWWGIMRTADNGSYPDVIEPRAIYYALAHVWKDSELSFHLSPNPALVGRTVVIQGSLKDALAQPINNTRVDVFLNGVFAASLFTNSSGWFKASKTVASQGTFAVNVTFAGDENYNPSSYVKTLTVYQTMPTNVSFSLSPNPVIVGQTVTLKGNLTDVGNNPISHAPVELWVKIGASPWQYVANLSTNSTGWFQASGTVASAGTYSVAVVYRGTSQYNLSYRIETLVVNP